MFAVLLLNCSTAHAAEELEIVQAHLESAEEGYKLSATFSFDLPHSLEEALNRTIPLYFTIDVELTRPRWYWFDEKALTASRTIRMDYNPLTRQYRVGFIESVKQNFTTLDDALLMLRRPGRWVVAGKDSLNSGETYSVSVRMRLNPEYLPKPFQFNALNNSDWHFASDWKIFNFVAE